MRTMNSLRATQQLICKSSLLQHIEQAEYVSQPFSEFDILNLQDSFLENGFHYFKVKNVFAGRTLINAFLQSLNFYHNVAALSLSTEYLKEDVVDIYNDLIMEGYLTKNSNLALEDFFLEKFYYDFVWIEITKDFLSSPWATNCLEIIEKLNLDQILPILILSFEDDE